MFIDQRRRVLTGHAAQNLRMQGHTIDRLGFGRRLTTARHRQLAAQIGNRVLQLAPLGLERLHTIDNFARLCLQRGRNVAQTGILRAQMG